MNTEQKRILTKAREGSRLTVKEATELLTVQGVDIYPVLKAAEKHKQQVVNDKITYVINYNLNLTNVCVNDCKFCGFSRKIDHQSSYQLSEQELDQHLAKVAEHDITEICLVSGLHPDFNITTYLEIIEKIKRRLPEIHLHGITPAELNHGLRNSELNFKEGYQCLKEAGLDSIPGTAAEILVPEVRNKICPDKISASKWTEAIKAAHKVGLKSTATILYGHLETMEQRVKHLKIIRDIQDQTGGFTEFIPLSFVYQKTPLGQTEKVTQAATGREDLLMIAVSRLFLDNIPNLQASWVKYGTKLAQLMLTAGANDLGGTLFNENISKAAGKETRGYLPPKRIVNLISDMGYIPQQRTTLYELV
ncbi:radical SAM domain protein, CofH subfamily [Halobacteroides halobius DSM 5150]|uniref:5-amino-6-(D-ribitylamino)uracil--L-tyrosine 4-hydroxyphenyl transferase n=1 Tax=Halobacteroides halobius (strain ATCC 35273 / DSM 5150 / MD-1) TaxID=748449 RepID=L0KA92_HALHC|nr:7,8-didemethyl-8-hydroxy-5-deazariboflavin synthase subunit CofH [Halobacteroides halobius]AGB42227.1 radical SAM domain protein, CofH subfamily [Halobacteroides halobius DSM 5150]